MSDETRSVEGKNLSQLLKELIEKSRIARASARQAVAESKELKATFKECSSNPRLRQEQQ